MQKLLKSDRQKRLAAEYGVKFRRATILFGLLVLLAACGGGGPDGGGSSTPILPPPSSGADSITVSGVVSDDPVSGATVIAYDPRDYSPLSTNVTDPNGRFTLQVPKTIAQSGFELRASGGDFNGRPFTGLMSGLYAQKDDLAQANVTLITSAIANAAKIEPPSGGAHSLKGEI